MARGTSGFNQGRYSERKRVMVLAGLAGTVVFAGLAVFLLFFSTSGASVAPVAVVVEKDPKLEMVDVLVPISAIESGKALEPTMFKREARPKLGLSPAVVKDFEEIKGYYSRSVISQDVPLHRDLITQVRPINQITAKIPEGFRAVTIRVDATSSVEGWARAGANVDVSWSTSAGGKPTVNTIVQNAKIISAERETQNGQNTAGAVPSTITLVVTANDAQKITLAQATGTLSLTLRGDNDPGNSTSTTKVTMEDLLNGSTSSYTPPKAEQPSSSGTGGGTVRVRNADGKMEDFVFEGGKLSPSSKQ